MQLKFGSGSSSGTGARTAGGKGCMTVFFLVFLLVGLGVTLALVVETTRMAAVWFWPEHTCTVLASGVEETGDDSSPYQPTVQFEYEIDGRSYQSTRASRGSSTTSSYDKARGPSDRFPPGSAAICRVNPERPDEAVLEWRFPWIGFAILLPLIFVAVGGGGLIFIWKGGLGGGADRDTESISQRATPGSGGRKVGLALGLIFTAVGGALSVFLLIIPVSRVLMATGWVETPALVVGSTIRSWSTDDGMSYSTDILYEYEAAGRSWRSNRLRFFPGNSGDFDDHRAMTDRYPVGAEITCFVHPEDPTKSVLDRRPSPIYLIGLFPLVFLVVGLVATAYSLRSKPKPTIPHDPHRPTPAMTASHDPAGSATLKPEAGPMAKVVGMIFVAAFWNGIVSVFVWQVVKGFMRGEPEWFLTIFMVPFVLVGLALIFGIFYFALALANPRPRVTITPAAPRLGTRLQIEWELSGRAKRIQRFKLVLEGVEKATYRRGTNTHTDREVFASIQVVNSQSEWEFARGHAEVAIPEDTMHSFTADNNAIEWSLHIHGDIARWPDLLETFEIEIRPLGRDRLLP